MSQITHGSVMYGQTVNTGDYNSKKCEVLIGFSLAENASETEARSFLDTASQIAISKAYELLALPKQQAKGAVAQVSTTAAPPAQTVAPAGKTKDQLAAEAQAAAGAPKTARAAKKPPKVEDDPAAMGDATGAQVQPKAEADPAAMVEDESLFGAEPAAAKKITDEEITSAITRRNAAIKNPPAIRQLIGTFVAHPGQARDIPAERRQEFLDKLATLQPPAGA